MAPRSAVPSRNSAKEAAIQLLSAVLGSDEEAAVAALGLEALAAVVFVTVVVVVVFVATAGFTEGCVACSAEAPPIAGSTSAEGSPLGVSVSPTGTVALSGSMTTFIAVVPSASTTPPAPKAPPAGATKRADASC